LLAFSFKALASASSASLYSWSSLAALAAAASASFLSLSSLAF
jgi:hypothetical protein